MGFELGGGSCRHFVHEFRREVVDLYCEFLALGGVLPLKAILYLLAYSLHESVEALDFVRVCLFYSLHPIKITLPCMVTSIGIYYPGLMNAFSGLMK